MFDSVHPHRQQPTRLHRPSDSPGKNTAVGCHFLLQCMKVKSESEVAQSFPTLHDPMDCSLPGSSKATFLNLSFHMRNTSLHHLGILLGKNWTHRGRRTLAITGLSWNPVINRSQRIRSRGIPVLLSVTQLVRKPQRLAPRVWL